MGLRNKMGAIEIMVGAHLRVRPKLGQTPRSAPTPNLENPILFRRPGFPLRSQIVTSKGSRGGRRYPPYAFTEHGAVMLASVLNSKVAVQASIQVVRAFIRLREILATHQKLARKVEALERKYDTQFRVVFDILRELQKPILPPRKSIGFNPEESL